jgi:Mn2+/Fe2+ NRAMP family transporter
MDQESYKYSIPKKFRPISAWGYIGYQILFSLPILGLILMIVFACSNEKVNRRNYARANLILIVISVIFTVVAFILAGPAIAEVFEELLQQYQ